MTTNDPYITAPAAHADLVARLVNRLHLDGEWDGALALLGGADTTGTAKRRPCAVTATTCSWSPT